ncbi:MAG: TolC family outer membrane protein [Pseudomonadota bacterium]
MPSKRALTVMAWAALAAGPSWGLDLMESWRAASAHDAQTAAARAAREAGAARAQQAKALWRPQVVLEGGAGAATNESATRGARFATPAFGSSTDVGFDTSVTGGTATRYALMLRQPLYDRERSAQARQLGLSAQAAEVEWQAARDALLIRTAERYFDVALAAARVRLLARQEEAVESARQEAEDRFRIGDRPVTDVHEATARAAALRAERAAAEAQLEVARAAFADLTGLRPALDEWALPAAADMSGLGTVDEWVSRAATEHPQVRLAIAQLQVAEEEARKTSAALSPTVDLVAQAKRDRLSGSGDFGDASHTAVDRAIGVQVRIPLYTGGWRSARHTESQALVERARAELERARQEAALQARGAWLDVTLGQSRLAALEAGLQAGRARLDATRVGLKAGDRTTLDLLNAENDAAAAELALLQARTQLWLRWLQLHAATGRLDEGALAQANARLAAAPKS